MKITLACAGVCLLLGTAGCELEGGYGGAYGVVGEYPQTYYTPAYPAPAYLYPYDRDYYWDRDHYWNRHGYANHHRW